MTIWNIYFWQADTVHVYGQGHVHAVDVTITARNLIVDDLGELVGDLHSIACEGGIGSGSSGNGASGLLFTIVYCVISDVKIHQWINAVNDQFSYHDTAAKESSQSFVLVIMIYCLLWSHGQ